MSELYDFDNRFLDVAKLTLWLLLYSRGKLLLDEQQGSGERNKQKGGVWYEVDVCLMTLDVSE
jgi:hypothetical protein